MSTLKTANLQNPASGIINAMLNADGTTTFGGVVIFDPAQTFPSSVSSITAGTGLTGGTITTTGTIALDTAYTDTLYLPLAGGTMTGDIVFAGTQTFPNAVSSITAGTGLLGGTITTTGTIDLDTSYTDSLYLSLAGGVMTGDITFSGTQTFPNAVSSITAGTGLLGGIITTTGTIDLDTAYTDTLYLGLAGGTMTGDIVFAGTQTFPGVLPLAGGVMTGDITFSGTQTFPAQNLQTVTTAGATTTDSVTVGGLTAAGLIYPAADGLADQVVKTDGAGNLGWLTTTQVVAAPAASADPGSFGQIAFGTGFFFFHDGTQWLRVAGSTF